jgi:hypothetical protein
MAVRVTIDFVCNEMLSSNLRFFKIKDGKELLYDQREDISVEESKMRLIDVLNGFSGDYVSIELYDKSNENLAQGGRNYTKRSYSVKLENSFGRGQAVAGIGGGGNDKYINQIMELQLKLMKQEFDNNLEKFKAESNKKEDPIMGIYNDLRPYIPEILGLEIKTPSGAATALAGAPQMGKEEYQVRLKAALKAWATADPESLFVLEAIANFANKDPQMYNTYRKTILTL